MSERKGFTIPKIGNLQTVGATIRKNREGEWVVRLWKDGKHYKPADYFTNDANDAIATAKDMVRRAEPQGVRNGVIVDASYYNKNPRKRLSQAEMLKNPSINRKMYLDGEVTHKQYYESIARQIGLDMSKSDLMPKVVSALERGDEHLNSIPLSIWDSRGISLIHRSNVHKAFKDHGDFVSEAGIVSLLKVAAIKAANRGFKRNPGTLRATRKAKPKVHSRTHFDTQGGKNKSVYVQQQRGAMWFTLAVAQNNEKGRKQAQAWAMKYHRSNPGTKLRLFV